MIKCPKCGRYMDNYLKQIFGGEILVYTCSCGYSREESDMKIIYSGRTTEPTENFYSYKAVKGE